MQHSIAAGIIHAHAKRFPLRLPYTHHFVRAKFGLFHLRAGAHTGHGVVQRRELTARLDGRAQHRHTARREHHRRRWTSGAATDDIEGSKVKAAQRAEMNASGG